MNQQEEQAYISRLQKYKQSQPRSSFTATLRERLHARIGIQSQDNSLIKQLTFFSVMKKYILPIALVAVVAAGTGYWYSQNAATNQPLISLNSDNKLLPGKYSITEVEQNSFGDLDKVSIISGETQKRNQSGGGNAVTANSAMPVGGDAMKMMAPSDTSSILPYGDSYRFVYEGETLKDLPSMQPVMKRLKPEQDASVVSRIVQMFSFGLMDMSKSNNARIQAFSVMEDKEYGMGVNVDLNYGSVNLYQNYDKWPRVDYRCDEKSCGSYPPITKDQVPSDEDAIAIASQFVSDYQISLEGYGQPRVYDYSTNWRILYERATPADQSRFIFPETINIVYPLTLEGKEVLDEGGNLVGIYVTIDIRSRKVNSLYGLETKQYEKSNYIGVNDVSRIMRVAERGGYHNGLYDAAGKVTNLHLDTPTVEMVKVWYSKDPNQPGQDLYVPALVFPIKDWEKNNYWRKNVIVPLVQDILDNENPSPQPIPLSAQTEPAANVKGVSDTENSSGGSSQMAQ